ncbi:MAG: hypothetical protein ABJE95_15060 [Byssovorax sp.]
MTTGAILNHDEILKLGEAALAARLTTQRDGLLVGIRADFIASLPRSAVAGEQVLTDLDALNNAGELTDGTVPLAVFLRNARALSGSRQASEGFSTALREVERWTAARGRRKSAEHPSAGAGRPREHVAPAPTSYARDWGYSALITAAAITTILAIFASGSSSELVWRQARLGIDGAHVAVLSVIFLCVWFFDQPPRLTWPGNEGTWSRECVDQFVDYWKRLWITWIILYGSYVVVGLDQDLEQQLGVGKFVFNNALQNLQSTTLLILFWTMIRPTLHVERNAYGLRKHHIPAWITCGVFALAEWIVLRRYPSDLAAAEIWPALLTGVAAATCMGMLIGRLESRFLDVHPIELFLLYLYAGLQPLYRILRLPNIQSLVTPDRVYLIEFVIKSLALALKLGLFFVVRRQLQSGRLAFYMWKVRVMHETVPLEWAAFEQEKL